MKSFETSLATENRLLKEQVGSKELLLRFYANSLKLYNLCSKSINLQTSSYETSRNLKRRCYLYNIDQWIIKIGIDQKTFEITFELSRQKSKITK